MIAFDPAAELPPAGPSPSVVSNLRLVPEGNQAASDELLVEAPSPESPLVGPTDQGPVAYTPSEGMPSVGETPISGNTLSIDASQVIPPLYKQHIMLLLLRPSIKVAAATERKRT